MVLTFPNFGNLFGVFRLNYVCSDVCGAWRQRWLVVKDTFLAYIRPKDGRVKCVMLYDSGFEVSSGIFSTGIRRGLHIMNLSRFVLILSFNASRLNIFLLQILLCTFINPGKVTNYIDQSF